VAQFPVIAELSFGQELLLVGLGALLAVAPTLFVQHRLEAAKAKREEQGRRAAGAKSATNMVRLVRSRLDSARSTLEAMNSEWPAGDEFALNLTEAQFGALEGRLDSAAWAALVDAQAHLESLQIRRALDFREGTFPPDGEYGTPLVALARTSLAKAERQLERLDQ